MRTLIYVPIIHTSADLGSMSKEVTGRGIATLGEETWVQHQKTVTGFWRSVWEYCDRIDAAGLKVYQDGMVADGSLGRRIVDDTAAAGSLNYQLVLNLLDRGACLVQTEEFDLVKREYDGLVAMTRAKTMRSRLIAVAKYKLIKTGLLRKRDAYIAGRVDESLESGEMGILFIGAVHKIRKRLAPDIQVREIKDRRKILDYQKLLPFQSRNTQLFGELSTYLMAPVVHRSCQGRARS